MQIDGYIRVSRVGARAGESFISPKVQREQIEAYATMRGFTIGEIHQDLDVSGAGLDRPGLNAALERCGSGETGGLVAAKLDRLTRSLSGLAQLVKQATDEGWTLVAIDHGLDLKTPGGALVANVLGAVAEWELAQRRQGWDVAQENAVGRGVHIASRTPTGYVRRDDKRLEPDPVAAPVIRDLFIRRARGDGWTALARRLDESGVRGPYGNGAWTASAVSKIVRNRVYLGEARSGRHTNPSAHAPLVSRAEFDAAQGDGFVSSARTGDGLMLAGVARCAGCRYLLKPDSMRGRNGERLGLYRCRGRHASGCCEASASVLAHVLDPHVEKLFLEAVGPGGPLAESLEASKAVDDALVQLEEAERDLDVFTNEPRLMTSLGPQKFTAAVETKVDAVRVAQKQLEEARRHGALTGPITPGDLIEAWPSLTIAVKRTLLTASLDAVFVRSGKGVPIEDRIRLVWRGDGPDDLPRRGHRVPLERFAWDETPTPVGV